MADGNVRLRGPDGRFLKGDGSSNSGDSKGGTATFTWNTDYALYVHEGYTTQAGNQMPARPWTKVAMANLDPEETFRKLFEENGGDAEAAFKDTSLLLGAEFTKEITNAIYAWPTGESPRDIVDTGQLRSSQSLEFS